MFAITIAGLFYVLKQNHLGMFLKKTCLNINKDSVYKNGEKPFFEKGKVYCDLNTSQLF